MRCLSSAFPPAVPTPKMAVVKPAAHIAQHYISTTRQKRQALELQRVGGVTCGTSGATGCCSEDGHLVGGAPSGTLAGSAQDGYTGSGNVVASSISSSLAHPCAKGLPLSVSPLYTANGAGICLMSSSRAHPCAWRALLILPVTATPKCLVLKLLLTIQLASEGTGRHRSARHKTPRSASSQWNSG